MSRPVETTAPDRITQLTTGPMTQTLRGIRRRIRYLTIDDLILLCRHFQCSIADLDYRFWAVAREARGVQKLKRRLTNQSSGKPGSHDHGTKIQIENADDRDGTGGR